ncbi:MAG: hypothetical protein AMXMBFR16_10680 [Candidatus Uhrbacteria bacterium]
MNIVPSFTMANDYLGKEVEDDETDEHEFGREGFDCPSFGVEPESFDWLDE